jgi:hypothetical protein
MVMGINLYLAADFQISLKIFRAKNLIAETPGLDDRVIQAFIYHAAA